MRDFVAKDCYGYTWSPESVSPKLSIRTSMFFIKGRCPGIGKSKAELLESKYPTINDVINGIRNRSIFKLKGFSQESVINLTNCFVEYILDRG